MNNMKKCLAVLAAAAMGLSFNACGSLLYAIMRANQSRSDALGGEIAEPADPGYAECDLSDTEDPRVTKVKLSGYDTEQGLAAVYAETGNVLHMGVVGRFGCPVVVRAENMGNFQLCFTYDASNMQNVPPENLIVLHYNEETGSYDTIESDLNEDAHSVTADITEEGVYLLADAYQWYGAWGADVSEYAHETTYTNDEYNFEMQIPEDIVLRYVSDYLKDDEDGKCKTLLECEPNDNIRIGIEYLERPYYDSAKAFMNAIAKALSDEGALRETSTLPLESGHEGYYCYSDFGDEKEHSYSINCIFPLSDTQYLNIWYGFKDEAYAEKAFTSLFSFRFLGDPNVPELSDSYEFTEYRDTVGKDIDVPLPDGLEWNIVNEDWEHDMQGSRTVGIRTALMRIEPNDKVLKQGIVLLEDYARNARSSAQAAINDAMNRTNTELRDTEQVKIGDDQYGYLFSLVHPNDISLNGYYSIPDTYQYEGTHQYIHVWLELSPDTSDADYQKYWECLKKVNTARPDQSITADNLKIDFPENFFAEAGHDFGWAYESDNDGTHFYRKWLLDTDHNKCREVGNNDYCGAFFYLLQYEDGRTAKEACEKTEQHYVNHDKFGYETVEKTEITMPCGLKGYLFCIRELSPPENKSYVSSAYMYGYYEVPDKDGNVSPEFVEVQYMLNEPLSDEVLQAYWNSLKSVDIVGLQQSEEASETE